jgi:hypothetical protein
LPSRGPPYRAAGGQLPSEGRFSAAGISEYGRSLHGVLHYHAKKRSSAWGGEWRNSN